MQSGLCPAETIESDPFLGCQETQGKQNGIIQVTVPPGGGKINNARPKGLESQLKPRVCRWAFPSLVLNVILIITIIIIIIFVVQPAKKSEHCPVATCPDGWVGYLGKCYYFSEAEANWASSQNNCSAHGASLAGIDSLEEMDFMTRYKGPSDYWIGLRRAPDQPWKWTNGTEFNNWFTIAGGEKCAFMNHNDISSSSCSREGRWICSKVVMKMGG
uniref:C-type lectin domain-containing protein n=1 Tax=Pelusios castaneus TaxID=367368 RepID=A0A8C8RKZ9_9SAUR